VNSEIYYKRDTTGNPLPPVNAPILVAPPNNSTGQSLTPLLNWDTVANASTFRAQVSADSLFGSTVFDTTILFTQITVPSGRLANNVRYFWRARGSNAFGDGPWSVVWNFTTALVGLTQTGNEIPKEYKLYSNYPNPFNPTTKIKFDLPPIGNGRDRSVKLVIYDILGCEVATLVNEQLKPSTYEVEWDAENYSSGIYYYKLTHGDYSLVKRMALLR
jgi:hypothetical protein